MRVIGTGVNLDGHVGQARQALESRFVDRRVAQIVRDDRADDGRMTRTDAPQVQIGDPVVANLEPGLGAIRQGSLDTTKGPRGTSAVGQKRTLARGPVVGSCPLLTQSGH